MRGAGKPVRPILAACAAGVGAGVSRVVGGAGKPVRPILAAFGAWQGAGFPTVCEVPPA